MTPLLDLELRALGVVPRAEPKPEPPAPAPVWDGKGECPF